MCVQCRHTCTMQTLPQNLPTIKGGTKCVSNLLPSKKSTKQQMYLINDKGIIRKQYIKTSHGLFNSIEFVWGKPNKV